MASVKLSLPVSQSVVESLSLQRRRTPIVIKHFFKNIAGIPYEVKTSLSGGKSFLPGSVLSSSTRKSNSSAFSWYKRGVGTS